MSADVGGCRHENVKACNNIGDDLLTTITSVDHAGSLGIVRDHAADFSAGVEADHAAYGGIDVADLLDPPLKNCKTSKEGGPRLTVS